MGVRHYRIPSKIWLVGKNLLVAFFSQYLEKGQKFPFDQKLKYLSKPPRILKGS